MLIVIDIFSFDIKYVYILEPVKNITKYGCMFMKTLYSTKNMTLNGIYLTIRFDEVDVLKEKENYFTFKIDREKNENQIKEIIKVEKDILKSLKIKCNEINYGLKEDLEQGNKIKLITQDKCCEGLLEGESLILRIVGIWSNSRHGGLSYQFIYRSDK